MDPLTKRFSSNFESKVADRSCVNVSSKFKLHAFEKGTYKQLDYHNHVKNDLLCYKYQVFIFYSKKDISIYLNQELIF